MMYGPTSATPSFFDEILEHYYTFRLPDLVGGEEAERKLNIDLPSMKPHWLSELVVDICLTGIVHAEQYIQNRSSSLLHELFWASSQYAVLKGRSAPVGSMFVTFLEKLLQHVTYLSNFPAKSQLRKDLLPSAVFVMQAAPSNLCRALWRKLCLLFWRKSSKNNFTFSGDSTLNRNDATPPSAAKPPDDNGDDYDILEVFGLLNLSLKTVEYEGSEENLDFDSAADARENIELWRREYLLALRQGQTNDRRDRRKRPEKAGSSPEYHLYTSSISRRWQAHDSSLVLVNTAHHIVLEMYSMLSATSEGRSFLNPAVRNNRRPSFAEDPDSKEGSLDPDIGMTYNGTILFVRAATSVYLQSLALRQSDIVIVRTFKVAAEAIKIFGIKIFLEALGETLQHWMRVLFINCGARRALVRVEATDLLELLLRSTWECYGSFFRIRVPLLAVQTEVMERIVSIAAARYYCDQRRQRTPSITFSYLNAEASLVPLWRTLDRIEKQPASQNTAFRGALVRMAEKLKKLYRAYVAARVLSFIRAEKRDGKEEKREKDHETEAIVRARRISVLRVINASEGYRYVPSSLQLYVLYSHRTYFRAEGEVFFFRRSPSQRPRREIPLLLTLFCLLNF